MSPNPIAHRDGRLELLLPPGTTYGPKRSFFALPQAFYEIKNGKITGMLNDVAYQANTREFWNSCTALCDEDDYRLGGSFNDGKGQPSQSSAVSHGSPTTRFNGVNVINTARKI